jgi:SPP1 family holin
VIDMKIKPATIARTAVLALALANQILSVAGLSPLPIDSATLEPWVTTGLTTAAAVWAWWKNNSFTPEAIRADELMKEMRG